MTKLVKEQHKHQKKYFNKEMIKWNKYHLAAWHMSYLSRLANDFLKKNPRGEKTLVDIGAGSGYISVEMARKGLNVNSVDISSEAIKNLIKFKKEYKLSNLHPVLSPAEKIKMKDNTADYIVANAILEHIVNEKETINEWKRILKPEGRIFITVPIKFRYIWPFFWPINYIHDKRIGHLRRYDKKTLEKKFGMKVLKVYYTGHFLKMLWVLASLFIKSEKMDELIEKIDEKSINTPYGSSNISVILEK